MKKNNRVLYLDVLNILACLSVVILHHNGIVHVYSPIRAWKTSLFFEVICYWAVPVFLMITGANLLNYRKKYDTKTFFKKRAIKIIIPFIFWAMFMLVWKNILGELDVAWNIKNIINMILNNREESIYYFIFMISGIYLTLPVLSKFANKNDKKILWYIVILLFITKSCLPILFEFIDINYNNYLSLLFDGHLIFVILGYLLSELKLSKKTKIIIYVLGILSCFFRYIVTFILSTKAGILNSIMFDYVQFHSVFLAVAVFVFIKEIKWDIIFKSNKTTKIISKLSGCSFGIYLIHMIVMYYVRIIFNIDIYSIYWRTLGSVLTYFISLIIVYTLKKIPILNKVVP